MAPQRGLRLSNNATIRNLAHLQESASTARVLNLLRVWKIHGRTPDYAAKPFFNNPVLNRSLFVKHRLRRDEVDLFNGIRQTATKVILPMDGDDLRVGGRSVFIGQSNYDLVMRTVFDEHWDNEPGDREMLQLLDELPSFDPFLLREHLSRHNRNPARCYFEISDADMQRMFRFVETQVRKLVDLCYAGVEGGASEAQGSRLVAKILSSKVDAETEPLRQVLRLEKPEYEEGVFCWKGFLYYKWSLIEALPKVTSVIEAIKTVKPRGTTDKETQVYIARSRDALGETLMKVCKRAQRPLAIYDKSFAGLVDGQPQDFREFLLGAPAMFTDLGQQLGAINHVVSFWRFRFPEGQTPKVTFEELQDIFRDFEESLAVGVPSTTLAA
jgi:hypothetical protein